jgi:hypothetical protein
VCRLFCYSVDEYLPVQSQKHNKNAKLYPVERNFSKYVFDIQLFVKCKYNVSKKLSMFFQTGAYLGGRHHGRTLNQVITLRPHFLNIGAEFHLSKKGNF